MRSKMLVLFPFAITMIVAAVECNSEVDALHALRTSVADPNNVLLSWDPTMSSPCTWFHVSCNSHGSVTRLDLGSANLSGTLVPQLGMLPNLQYLELYGNSLSGSIPKELGNLTRLVSLDLYHNQFTGHIPSSLGNLRYLKFLRLNSNKLSGRLPNRVLQLTRWGNLQILNVSDNHLAGTNKPGHVSTTIIVQDAKA